MTYTKSYTIDQSLDFQAQRLEFAESFTQEFLGDGTYSVYNELVRRGKLLIFTIKAVKVYTMHQRIHERDLKKLLDSPGL